MYVYMYVCVYIYSVCVCVCVCSISVFINTLALDEWSSRHAFPAKVGVRTVSGVPLSKAALRLMQGSFLEKKKTETKR